MSDAPTAGEGSSFDRLAEALRAADAAAAAEKSRLRRRVWRLRLIAGLAIIAAVVAALSQSVSGGGDHIARVMVSGLIVDDPARDKLLADLAEDDSVKGVMVRIDSPGGTTVGGEALYESLRALAEKKPVTAVLGEVAASAAYIAALASDHVVARGNTITASVGVIFTAPNVHGALQNLGVEVVEVKSGAQKAEPSPYRPVSQARLDAERVLVDDSFAWFVGLVESRRSLAPGVIDEISDGRILTGRMALERGLVDVIGGEASARTWLESEHGVSPDIRVRDREPEREPRGFFGGVAQAVFGSFGGAEWASALAAGPLGDLVAPGPRLRSELR